MSVMYDQFTAMSTGAYNLRDYTATLNASDLVEYKNAPLTTGYVSANASDFTPALTAENQGGLSTSVSDKESPVIRLHDAMPVYAAIDTYVQLPAVSATSNNGIASTLDIKVTHADGETVPTYTKSAGDTGTDLTGNKYTFEAVKHGTYTVSYTAIVNGNKTDATYYIKAGDVVPPTFNVINKGLSNSNNEAIIGYINGKPIASNLGSTSTVNAVATVGDRFEFGIIEVPAGDGQDYVKQLKSSDGETVETVTRADRRDNGNTISFSMSGTYTVVYKVADKYGNATEVSYKITVNSSTVPQSTQAITILTVVLLVVGIVLVAGAVIYFVRFRKHKR